MFNGEGTVYERKSCKYHPQVLVEFNTAAYINNTLFLKYIEPCLMPVLNNKSTPLTIDLCSAHKTATVLDSLQAFRIMSTLIPEGCTNLIQPFDVSIHKRLKAWITDLTDETIFECEKADDFEKTSLGQRRVLTTLCVGDAWYQLCVKKQELVKQVFRKEGLSLPVDKSAYHELNNKGFSGINIGDWKTSNNHPDLYHKYVDKQHDDCNLIEFVADGE